MRWRKKTTFEIEKRRAYNRARNYNLSPDAFEQLREEQHNSCGICQREFSGENTPHVDHDHETKIVRGLLCGRCNRAIGLLGDSKEGLILSLRYLINGRGISQYQPGISDGPGSSIYRDIYLAVPEAQ